MNRPIYILNFNRPRRDHVGHVARSAVGQLAAAGRNRVDITACSVPLSAVTGDARPRWSVCPFIYGLHCTVVQSQHASDSNAISACRSSLTHTRAHHLYRLTVATYWHSYSSYYLYLSVIRPTPLRCIAYRLRNVPYGYGQVPKHEYKTAMQGCNVQLAVHVVPFVRDTETICLLYTSPSPRDGLLSRMPSSA